jgi:hypothetical protein
MMATEHIPYAGEPRWRLQQRGSNSISRRIYGLSTDTAARSTSTLDFDDRSETASGEGLLELWRDRVVRVKVGMKCGEEDTAVSIPSDLFRDVAGRWREVVDRVGVAKEAWVLVAWLKWVDSQVANTHFWCYPRKIASFSSQAENPRPGIFQVDLGVSRANSRERNTIPTTEFEEILDSQDVNLEDDIHVSNPL